MSNIDIKRYASKGGKQRARNLTSKERSLSASNAAKARWKAYKDKKNHICTDMCVCSNCGRLKYKHVPNSEICPDFKCDRL